MVSMIPITKDDGVVFVISMIDIRLIDWMNDEGSSQSVDVLTCIMTMDPICTPLFLSSWTRRRRVQGLVSEGFSLRDWTLSDSNSSIKVRSLIEELTVSMKSSSDTSVELIGSMDPDNVGFVDVLR